MNTKYSRLRKRKKEHEQTVGYRKVRRQQQRINQGRLSRMAARKVARAQSGSRQQRRIHSSASPTIRRFARRTQSVGGEKGSVDPTDTLACLRYAFRNSKRKPPTPGDTVYITGWGYGTITRYCGRRIAVQGDYGSMVFSLNRCQEASIERGMDWTEFYQYQKAHGLAGKSVVWHQKGQFYSDMPPFRFANMKAL
jgi:hypothetical protein